MAVRLLQNGAGLRGNPPTEPGGAGGVAVDEHLDAALRERERWCADRDVAADQRSEAEAESDEKPEDRATEGAPVGVKASQHPDGD